MTSFKGLNKELITTEIKVVKLTHKQHKKAYNLKVELFLDEESVEVRVFLGLDLFKCLIKGNIVTVNIIYVGAIT